MKYTLSNTINKPLKEVIDKFKDPEGVKYWMEGFQRAEQVSGEPGEVGSVSNFYFLHKNKEMKIEETILEQNFPNQVKFAYRSSMGYNEVEMLFEEISKNTVKQTNNSYFEMKVQNQGSLIPAKRIPTSMGNLFTHILKSSKAIAVLLLDFR